MHPPSLRAQNNALKIQVKEVGILFRNQCPVRCSKYNSRNGSHWPKLSIPISPSKWPRHLKERVNYLLIIKQGRLHFNTLFTKIAQVDLFNDWTLSFAEKQLTSIQTTSDEVKALSNSFDRSKAIVETNLEPSGAIYGYSWGNHPQKFLFANKSYEIQNSKIYIRAFLRLVYVYHWNMELWFGETGMKLTQLGWNIR